MKKNKSIRLHPEFGVNPSVTQCPACGKDVGVALFGYNKGKEAPRSCIGDELCDDCKRIVLEGNVIIIRAHKEKDAIQLTGRYGYIPRETLNIDIPKCGYLLMENEHFDRLFVNEEKQNEKEI